MDSAAILLAAFFPVPSTGIIAPSPGTARQRGSTLFRIGNFIIDNHTILAPMAGVTDLPFRQLCRRFGAGLAVSEMVTADTRLWASRKSRTRLPHAGESEPRMVQIAGGEPAM